MCDGGPQKNNFFFPACFLDTLCINHTPINPATETIKANVCSATNPMALPKRIKIAPTTLSMIAANSSTAFPASLLSVSANLSNHLFKAPLSFAEEISSSPSPAPKSPMAESTIVVIPVTIAVSV